MWMVSNPLTCMGIAVHQSTLNIWIFILLTGNGYIDYDELKTVLKSCMNESALKFSDAKLDELTR